MPCSHPMPETYLCLLLLLQSLQLHNSVQPMGLQPAKLLLITAANPISNGIAIHFRL